VGGGSSGPARMRWLSRRVEVVKAASCALQNSTHNRPKLLDSVLRADSALEAPQDTHCSLANGSPPHFAREYKSANGGVDIPWCRYCGGPTLRLGSGISRCCQCLFMNMLEELGYRDGL
jgi:hypothetical protein